MLQVKPHDYVIEERYIGDNPSMYLRIVAIKFIYEHCERPVTTEIYPAAFEHNTYYMKATDDMLTIFHAPMVISEGVLWNSHYLKPQIFAKVTYKKCDEGGPGTPHTYALKAKKVRPVPKLTV